MYQPKSCFVIMPYGKKRVGRRTVNFDKVYDTFHKPLIENLGYKAIRCDKLDSGGSIHLEMFQHIYDCGLVLVDVTSCNPNVMYELGVRHTLTRGTSIMLKQADTTIPFNISGYPILDYEPSDSSSLSKVERKIAKRLAEIHKQPHKSDSPVLDRLKVAVIDDSPQIPLQSNPERIDFRLHDHAHDKIGVIKGDLRSVKNIDIWVNSENTHMEMARPIERSISSIIRYYGARRDKSGGIIDDSIYLALTEQKKKARAPFAPATVLETESGELKRSNKVQKIRKRFPGPL